MQKILQINVVVNSGSTGRIAEEIGKLAIAKGWQNYIAYGRNERPSQSELIRIGTDWDMKIHGLQTRLFDRHGLGSINATKQFVRKIEQINPDIIHLHNIHGYYLNYPILFEYLSSSNIPVVWTLHDCWPITGHCVYFDFIGCEKWKTQCYACPQKSTYPANYFQDRSNLNYLLKKELFSSLEKLTLVPVSEWLAKIMRDSFLKKKSIKVIHNGIDTDSFRPIPEDTIRNKYKLADKFVILGVASIWSPRKGLDDFIDLYKRLDSSYQIILVGLSKKQIKTLPSAIIGIERTESVNELAELYSESDVFLNPTYEDNFPTTNLESMACGTPVITYRTGGSPESINEDTGLIIEKGNIEGLISAIEKIKENGKTFYSKACVNRAKQLYKNENKYKEYLDLYTQLLK